MDDVGVCKQLPKLLEPQISYREIEEATLRTTAETKTLINEVGS